MAPTPGEGRLLAYDWHCSYCLISGLIRVTFAGSAELTC